MRADRLVATLLILQARGRVTAAEVAEQLEVSERTARRDLDALGMAGIPVYSQQGRGGGWSLIGGARTDLSGLTAAEARALFLVTGPSSAATPEVKAALRKLVRALPESFRADAEAAATAVVVDPASWGRSGVGPAPKYLEPLQQAVVTGVQVQLGYAGRDRPAGERTVHPLGLVAKSSVWYLVADTDAGLRTFRVSRVTSATLTTEAVRRPDGFDLAETWRSIAATVDERRASFRVALVADPGVVPVLGALLGSRLKIAGSGPDGRVELEVGGRSAEMVAAELAGFGAAIEVTAPEEARHYLARLGVQLSERYRAAPAVQLGRAGANRPHSGLVAASFRLATPGDGGAIRAIYAPFVASTVISFESEVPSVDQIRARLAAAWPNHPWLVAEEAGRVIGYAYAHPFAPRAAYRWSVETSIYLDPAGQGRGVGRALYSRLLAMLAAQGYQQAFAGIALPNPASQGLHEAMGFRPVAAYHRVGWKFGSWVDVGWWQRAVSDESAVGPGPPIPLDRLPPDAVLAALAETPA